ncbi:MAG TPA: hypothetical protein VIL78_03465 [Hanamia sp.]
MAVLLLLKGKFDNSILKFYARAIRCRVKSPNGNGTTWNTNRLIHYATPGKLQMFECGLS